MPTHIEVATFLAKCPRFDPSQILDDFSFRLRYGPHAVEEIAAYENYDQDPNALTKVINGGGRALMSGGKTITFAA